MSTRGIISLQKGNRVRYCFVANDTDQLYRNIMEMKFEEIEATFNGMCVLDSLKRTKKPQLICRNITVGLCGKDYKPCFCSVDKGCAGLRNAFRAHTPVSHICHKLLEIVSITDIYYRYPSGSGIIHFHTKCSGRIEAYRTLRAYLVIYRPVCAGYFGVKNYPLPQCKEGRIWRRDLFCALKAVFCIFIKKNTFFFIQSGFFGNRNKNCRRNNIFIAIEKP